MLEAVLAYLWLCLVTTLIQLLVLAGPGLLLTLVLNYETAFIQKQAVKILGTGWYLGLFGWLGTTVHELGHALFCIIFGHRIVDIKLFHPDPETGTLGYVKHSYNRSNFYHLAGNLFIGIGPILSGTAVIYLLSYALLNINPFVLSNNFNLTAVQLITWEAVQGIGQGIWSSAGQLLAAIFSTPHLLSWQLYVFLYLVFAVASSITLSPPDIQSALSGLGIIAALVFVLNLATSWAGNITSQFVTSLVGYSGLFYALVFLMLLINLAATILILLPGAFLRPHKKS